MKEEVEELKDDFEEIKEMQKTQELKKIQEDKIVEDNKVEEKEKKCHPMFVTFLIIILMIAFTGMGFLGGVYYYKNSLNKQNDGVEKSDKKEKKEEEKIIELTEEEKKSIDTIVYDLNYYFSDFYSKGISSVPNQNLLFFALKKIGFNSTISKDEVENIIKTYFGDGIHVDHESIKCSFASHEPLYYYENGVYTENENHGGHGGGNIGGSDSELNYIFGTKKGNNITVKYKIAYHNKCSDVCVTYELYDYYNGKATLLYSTEKPDGGIEPLKYTDEIYESIKDKLHVTTFTFVFEDNNYHLKAVTIE